MSLAVSISSTELMVEDKAVASTQDILAQIKANPNNYMIEGLYNDLLGRSEQAKKMEADYGTPFSAEVTVQIDENVPFELLTRLLYTCGQSAWSNMKLVVYMPGE